MLLKRAIYFGMTFCGLFLGTITLSGCGGGGEYNEVSDNDRKAANKTDEESDHVHTAPHGGHLIELGNHEFNLEVCFDETSKELTLYVLDAHAENPVAISPEDITFELDHDGDETVIEVTAKPQEGDADGMSSVFVATDNEHLKELADIEAMHGHAHVTIDGQEYEGELEHDHEEDHDDEEGSGE